MTDYASFKYGAVQYPLPLSGLGIGGSGASLLRDCDPALFFLLEFFSAVITRHVGPRLLAEATAAGMSQIKVAVAETLPLNPEAYLTAEHVRFPLLTAHREKAKFEDIGGQKLSVDEIKVSYVLPPLDPGEAEALLPILKAVAGVIDNRAEQGMDPLYTPTGSTAGAQVWGLAGVATAGVKAVAYGGYAPTEDLYFPAVMLTLEIKERSDVAVEEFDTISGDDVSIDLVEPLEETVVPDFVQFSLYPPPTITLASPNTGTKAGGTVVTLTGTGFRSAQPPKVRIGNVLCASVTVLDSTHLQVSSPAHGAFPTAIVDVDVEDDIGRIASLMAGYTYTTP